MSLEPDFTDANGVNGEHGIESVFEIGALGKEDEAGNQYANVQGVEERQTEAGDLTALHLTFAIRLKLMTHA